MDLAELLQWIGMGRKNGSLTFIKRKTKNYIYFREGKIVSSSSNDPTKYLGQFLLFQGKITEAQLKRALELHEKPGVVLGKVLVQEGIVSQDEIEKALVTRTEEVIYDLFLWEDGYFHFTDNGYNIDDLILIKVDVNSIIFEGVRRKDEWGRIRGVFPSNNVTLKFRHNADLKSGTFSSLQKKLLFLVTQSKTISEMVLELHGSEFLVSFELFQLYEQNIIEIGRVLETQPEVEEEDPNKAFNLGLQLMEKKKYREAISTFQEILRADPNNMKAHEQIDLAEKAICQELYQAALPPNKIPHFLIKETDLSKYNLTPQEGFAASRINGAWDIKSIVMLSPLQEFEVLQILDKLIKMKIIGLK